MVGSAGDVQGIFTFSHVGKLGTPVEERTYLDAGVWRYHPLKKKFEVYSEGASNQWGVDWNDWGQACFEACVIPHMFQCIQGARYQRQAGQHPNKFTYEDIKKISRILNMKSARIAERCFISAASGRRNIAIHFSSTTFT